MTLFAKRITEFSNSSIIDGRVSSGFLCWLDAKSIEEASIRLGLSHDMPLAGATNSHGRQVD